VTPAQAHEKIQDAVAGLRALGSASEDEAIAYAAHLAAQPGIVSATFNPANVSIDLVVEVDAMSEIAATFQVGQ
jgi:hypothetical protein